MILHNENTFSANNRDKNVWTLNNQGILRFKERRKEIMVSDFLLS